MFFEKIKIFEEKLIENDAEYGEIRILTKENTSLDNLANYSQANHSFHKGVSPLAIFYPTNTDEIKEMVKICDELNIPIVPYGSGTSVEGSIVPLKA